MSFTRAFHCCISLGVELPPHPQNTSAVVGHLKYRSGSINFWVLSEILPINPVQTVPKKTQKPYLSKNIVRGYPNRDTHWALDSLARRSATGTCCCRAGSCRTAFAKTAAYSQWLLRIRSARRLHRPNACLLAKNWVSPSC